MDDGHMRKTRSSTRQKQCSLPVTSATDAIKSTTSNGSSLLHSNSHDNPFAELMQEHDSNGSEDDLYMNYSLQGNETGQIQSQNTKTNTATGNRMVHFRKNELEDEDDQDIPSMLITTASHTNLNEKYSIESDNENVLRMNLNFGNLHIRRDGPMDLVTDGLFSTHDQDILEVDENGLSSFGSTSADLRATVVCNWLTDHYEPQENISLPRSVLYDHYLEFCQTQGSEPVNSATFGKIIRSVFPTLRTRRLGTRGNSKYHYFGIGLKADLIGNDQFSAIYAQYSRPTPSRPRKSKSSSSSQENENQDQFSYSTCNSYSTTGAAASHVYSASSSRKNINRSQRSSRGGGTRRTRSSRNSRHHHNSESNFAGEHSDEALLLGHNGLLSYQSSGNNENGSMGAFRSLSSPNYDDFAHFLEQICAPVFSNVPPHVTFDSVQAFSLVYQQHIIDLLRAISSHEFTVVEGLSEMFWMNFPPEMLNCLHCEESLRIVAIADDYLYQVLIHTLIPDVLEPIPIAITQSVRQFSKFLEGILQRTLQTPIPNSIIEVKLDSARRFCQVLRRRTSLSHLTQALRSILCNSEQTQQMLLDWSHVDFQGIREQCDWIMRLKEGFLPWIEASFRTYLQDGVSLHVWSSWIENITDQCIGGEQVMGSNLEEACSIVILRWTFYSSMIMRDLTLRSAASFGSFHLLNLLFNEYLLYSVEKRLDDHRRSVGLMSFWPGGNLTNETSEQQQQLVNNNINSNSNITTATNVSEREHEQQLYQHQQVQAQVLQSTQSQTQNVHHLQSSHLQQQQQHFAFDDFFRKSAVLGPTSSPLVNSAAILNSSNVTSTLSKPSEINNHNNNSPLASKPQHQSFNHGYILNKENNAATKTGNDYNLNLI